MRFVTISRNLSCCCALQMQPGLLGLHAPALGRRPQSSLSHPHGFSTQKFTDRRRSSISAHSRIHTVSVMSRESRASHVDDSGSFPISDGLSGQENLRPLLDGTLVTSSVQVPYATSRYQSQATSRTADSKALLRLVKDTYIQKAKKRMLQRQRQEQQGEQTYAWKDIPPVVSTSHVQPISPYHNHPTHQKDQSAKHPQQGLLATE